MDKPLSKFSYSDRRAFEVDDMDVRHLSNYIVGNIRPVMFFVQAIIWEIPNPTLRLCVSE